MPRYFFHLSGDDPSLNEGVEFAGLKEVCEEASVAAGEMLRDMDGTFWTNPDWQLQVTDEEGATVCLLTIKGTVSPE